MVCEATRAASKEQKMVDQRPSHVRHLNERMTMPQYRSKAAWAKRAAWLREHILVSCGLMPLPEKTPLNPQIFGRIERDGYSIEKVYLESRPGFYVCGNLYRPLGKKGPFPGVACPHGHWGQGRFGHEPGRGSVPGRCITLARMGCVVFSYDMVGYNDSGKQIGHRWSSKQDELWGISVMGLQLWNSIRVIDFLQSLPDVDPERIGVTGASGGGTQTFMVMGIEPRVKLAAPVCMISCSMQGGCVCENAPLLRIETNNMEIGALMAPRPLLLVSASKDWTSQTPKVEYPSIRGVYQLHGAADRVTNAHFDAGHNYNKNSREAMYTFFRRWLLGIKGKKKYAEPPFTVEKKDDLLVWRGRKLPKGAKKHKSLEGYIIADCRRQRDALLPKKADARERFLETLGAAYRHAILAELPKARDLDVTRLESTKREGLEVTRLLLGRKGRGDRVPAVLYRPKNASARAPACLVVHPEGKGKLVDPATGKPGKLLDALLATDHVVLTIDAYLTGESAPLRAALKKNQKGKAYFSAYNRTAVVERVQDILTALAYLKSRRNIGSVSLVGLGQAGAWCLLAAPFTPDGTRLVADLAQLSGDDDSRWLHDLFSPCILKAGGPWTATALAAPRPLFLHNVAGKLDTKPLRAAYRAAGAPAALRIESRPCGHLAIARWLGEKPSPSRR